MNRQFGETFKRFTQCLMWAKEGKTFIYWHPDFVAIDVKSWEKLQKKLNPPIKHKDVFYDEYMDMTPEMEKRVAEIIDKVVAKP